MPMLEGQVEVVIGVDTRRDTHAAAVLDPNGGLRATPGGVKRPLRPCPAVPAGRGPGPRAGGCGPWKERVALGPG